MRKLRENAVFVTVKLKLFFLSDLSDANFTDFSVWIENSSDGCCNKVYVTLMCVHADLFLYFSHQLSVTATLDIVELQATQTCK